MENILDKMDKNKRKRLINSALEEFSNNTFEKASTNNIVKNAEISKGLLYHYFSTKQALYDYLEKFCYNRMMKAVTDCIDWKEGDLFERIKTIIVSKMKVINEYPHLVKFYNVLIIDSSVEEIKRKVENIEPNIYERIYSENIDWNLFKSGLDVKKAISIVEWTLEKYSEQWMLEMRLSNKEFDINNILEGINQYLDILKMSFYK